MWKWIAAVTGSLILLSCLPSPARADVSADVTVTAVGIVVDAPEGFTVTYINDYEVGISWGKPAGAENTMIRAKYGSMPDAPDPGTEPTDGYLVYYGTANYTSDTAVSLDETATPVYYRAWSETAGGAWSPLWGEGQVEGIGMTLIAFVLLVLGLTVVGFVMRKQVLAVAAGGAWLVLSVYSYTQSSTTWDIFYALFFLGAGMVIVCMLEPVIMRAREGIEDDTTLDEIDSTENELKQLRRETRIPKFGAKRKAKRLRL